MKVVTSTGKCKHMHGSFNLTGVTQMLKFMYAPGLWYNEKKTAEVKLHGRRVHKDLRAKMRSAGECSLSISNLSNYHVRAKSKTDRETEGLNTPPVARAFIAIQYNLNEDRRR